VNGLGWYVDDFQLTDANGNPVWSDNVEGGTNYWNAVGWTITTGRMENKFAVTLIAPHQKDQRSWTDVYAMKLDPVTEKGSALVDTKYLKNGVITAVIDNHPDGVMNGGFRLTGEKV
jgi:hypothetical protein